MTRLSVCNNLVILIPILMRALATAPVHEGLACFLAEEILLMKYFVDKCNEAGSMFG